MVDPVFLFWYRVDAKCGRMRVVWYGLLKLTLVFVWHKNVRHWSCLDLAGKACIELSSIYTSLVIVCPERTFACGALANLWIDVFSIFPSQKAINRTLPYSIYAVFLRPFFACTMISVTAQSLHWIFVQFFMTFLEVMNCRRVYFEADACMYSSHAP
mgnify:CR=1 FL=1